MVVGTIAVNVMDWKLSNNGQFCTDSGVLSDTTMYST